MQQVNNEMFRKKIESIEESKATRQSMNPAAALLGPLYDLYIAALGNGVGTIVSYVTLLAIISLIAWALSNRNEIINGLDIRGATIKDLAIFILLTGAVYAVASDYLGFPVVGALTTAVSSSIFFRWTMTALEGEPV